MQEDSGKKIDQNQDSVIIRQESDSDAEKASAENNEEML